MQLTLKWAKFTLDWSAYFSWQSGRFAVFLWQLPLRMSKLIWIGFIFATLFLALQGCISHKFVSVTDLAPNYRSELTVLHPSFKIYHQSEGKSLLYFSIPKKDVLFMKSATSSQQEAQLAIGFRLVANFESTIILDSGSVKINDEMKGLDEPKGFISGFIKIQTPGKEKYLLKLRIQELNRHIENFYFVDIDKTNFLCSQNYFAQYADDSVGSPGIFNEQVKVNSTVQLNYTATKVNQLLVHYFKQNFPMALPPHDVSVQKSYAYKPDSIFTIAVDEKGGAQIKIDKPGFFHVMADTSKRIGLTLKCFAQPFPSIERLDQMLEPLRYIVSKEEFKILSTNKRLRKGIEQFWMNCGGKPEVAKELIKKYYNRVVESNLFFTSYLEGWKSDRGMIYIVFGPPSYVYRNNDSETWVYGDNSNANAINFNNPNNITFNFDHIANPFSDNDFALERSVIYKLNWVNAVDNWRQGAVFFQN